MQHCMHQTVGGLTYSTDAAIRRAQCPFAGMALTLEAPRSVAEWRQTAVVLYCEFSSERAPRLYRHIRNTDRKRHLDSYPQLDVPHMCAASSGHK